MGKHEVRRVPGTGVHPSLVPHLFDGVTVLEQEPADEVGTLVTDEDEAAAEASLVLAGEADENGVLDEYGSEPVDYAPKHAAKR